MPKFYEVQYFKDLEGTDQHGNITSSVRFVGETESALYRHAPSTTLEAGQKLYGTIEEKTSQAGNQYFKFTRETPPEGTSQNSPEGSEAIPILTSGARQGMCINNAAAIVTKQLETRSTPYTPPEFANEVEAFARELYKIDLDKVSKSREEEIMEIMSE